MADDASRAVPAHSQARHSYDTKGSTEFRRMVSLLTKDKLVEILCGLARDDPTLMQKIKEDVNADPSLCKIFVRSLSWETTSESLQKHFAKYGEVKEAVVVTDRATNKSKGYGFVNFKNAGDAARALKDAMKVIDGRNVYCNLAAEGNPNKRPLTSPSPSYTTTHHAPNPYAHNQAATHHSGASRGMGVGMGMGAAGGAADWNGAAAYAAAMQQQQAGVQQQPQQQQQQHSLYQYGAYGAMQGYGSTSRTATQSNSTKPLPHNFRPGDWMCPKCQNHNYKDKMKCHRCGAPRNTEQQYAQHQADAIAVANAAAAQLGFDGR